MLLWKRSIVLWRKTCILAFFLCGRTVRRYSSLIGRQLPIFCSSLIGRHLPILFFCSLCDCLECHIQPCDTLLEQSVEDQQPRRREVGCCRRDPALLKRKCELNDCEKRSYSRVFLGDVQRVFPDIISTSSTLELCRPHFRKVQRRNVKQPAMSYVTDCLTLHRILHPHLSPNFWSILSLHHSSSEGCASSAHRTRRDKRKRNRERRRSRARKPWSANCELRHWNFRGEKCLIHGLHFTV